MSLNKLSKDTNKKGGKKPPFIVYPSALLLTGLSPAESTSFSG
jgi:hypothetical protein